MARFGGSTYSRQPFRPQFEALRAAGFDYAELDLTWLRVNPDDLRREAFGLSELLAVDTAHLPPPKFTKAHLEEFRAFLSAVAPVGCRIFNVHLAESRFGGPVPIARKIPWLRDLVDTARGSHVDVTLENLDETPETLRTVLDAIPDLGFCLDIGHANLDGFTDRPFRLLEAFGPRLRLVHAHDNRGGHGEAGDLHLPFGKGGIDFARTFAALKQSGFDGHVTLEIFRGGPEDRRASLEAARRLLA